MKPPGPRLDNPPDSNQRRIVRAILLMVAAHFCFTLMMALIKQAHALETAAFPDATRFGTWEAVLFRSLPMTLVCAWLLRGQPIAASFADLSPHTRRWLLVRGFVGASSMACLFYGSIHVPIAVASLFSNANVFFIGVLAHVFLSEKITKSRAVCTVLGFLGITLVLAEGLTPGGQRVGDAIDYFITFSSGFLSAVAYFSVRKMKAVPATLIILSLAVAGLVLAGIGFVLQGFHPPRDVSAFLVLALSSVPAIVGQFCMTWSFQSAQAGLVSTGQYAGPVFAAGFGALFFSERLTQLELIGAAIAIVFGVALPIAETLRASAPPLAEPRNAAEREILG